MRANTLSDAELRRKTADELASMTARINRGEAIHNFLSWAGILVIDGKVWRTMYYWFATREEREGKVCTNLDFQECRQSTAMKRVLMVYKRTSMDTPE